MSLALPRRRAFAISSSRKSPKRNQQRSRFLQSELLESRQLLTVTVDLVSIPRPAEAQVHGFKWEDINQNGNRDAGEPGIPGVVIYSDNNRNNAWDEGEPQTLTMRDDPNTEVDEAGLYWLGGIEPGRTVIREIIPQGFDQTYPGVLPCLAPDCDGSGHMLGLAPGDVVQGVDFGNIRIDVTGSVHGRKWIDENGNGQLDSNEGGLAGVTIYVDLNKNDALDKDEPSALTMRDDPNTDFDESGMYWIEGVEPGFHFVREVVPAGYEQTFPGHVQCRALFCIGDGHIVNLESGQTIEGLDFGNAPARSGSIHGTKWLDRNGNGRREPNEPGLAGVTIYVDANRNGQLDNSEPRTVSMEDDPDTDFDEAGLYWLERLPAGEHVIREIVPDGYAQTFPARGIVNPEPVEPIDPSDEPFSQVAPELIELTLAAGETHVQEVSLTVEPLCVRPYEVDVVATSADVNFENHSGVIVNGCGGDTSVFEISMTGIGVPQSFALEFVDAEFGGVLGQIPVAIAAFTDGAHHVVLTNGGNVEGIDFGNRPDLASIHGTKWLDQNGNGIREDNEPGIAGVTVYSDLNRNGEYDLGEPQTQTMVDDPRTAENEAGRYWLQVRPGKNAIREIVPIDFEQTFPRQGVHEVVVEAGSEVTGVDFGNSSKRRGSVQGVKWRDDNGNGVRDRSEPAYSNVTVYADLNNNAKLDPGEPRTLTEVDIPETDFDEAGRYSLDLEPGEYLIREVVPKGFSQTFPHFVPFDEEPQTGDEIAIVNPESIIANLAAGEILETEVSFQIDALCFEALTIDVIASNPDIQFENLTGKLVNGCGGDKSEFKVAFEGDGQPQQFHLQFIDFDFGGGVLAEIPVSINAPDGSGAHRVLIQSGQSVEGRDFGNYPLYLPGDANRSGKVEFADFLRLSRFFGKEGGWTEGDFNGDRQVTFADFLDLAKNFGKYRPELPEANTPPPPESFDLVFAGMSESNEDEEERFFE